MANGLAENLAAYLSDERLSLPPPLDAAVLARQISSWMTAHKGATFNLFFGSMAGQSLYAVSLYPERSVVISGETVSENLLRRFIQDNLDLLTDPRSSIGLWYGDALQAVYLDVSVTLPDRAEAIAVGERYNQEAIYDLEQEEVLDTGGTGEWQEGWAGESMRLPPLQRQQARGTSDG